MSQDLLASLKKVRAFLEVYEVHGWSSTLHQLEDQIQHLDPQDIAGWRRFLTQNRLFGGMGALDDLVICRTNGYRVQDESRANQEYMVLVRDLKSVFRECRARYGVLP